MMRAALLKVWFGTAAWALAAAGAGAAEFASPADSCAPSFATAAGATRYVGEEGTTRIRFAATQSTALGSIETFTTLTSQRADALTANRLVASDRARLGDDHRVMIAGMTARLLDDRLTVTTQMGLSDFTDRSSGRVEARRGSAHMVRLDVKLADTQRLRWSVAGEMSNVDEDFFIGQAFADGGSLALPGRRMALSSSLTWQRARVTAAIDDFSGRFGTFESRRVGVSRHGLSLSLRSMQGRFDAGQGASQYLSRTESLNASLGFDLATMAPALAMDERLPAALLPKSATLSIRRGSSQNRFAGTVEQFERRGIELDATWETPIGESSLGYWRDRRVGATTDLGQREERVVTLSHMVRRGGWRFGVDAMIANSTSTRGSGLSDRNVALGGSIAYEVANGPRLMLQLSNDRGRMATEDDSFLTARRGQQISATLDLTDYLRRRFERDDLRLKIDYRKQLDRSTTAVSAYQQLIDRWSDGSSGEGLLVSFGMKL